MTAAELFLLDAAEYEDAARLLGVGELSRFATTLVVDRPLMLLDADELLQATGRRLPDPECPGARPPAAPEDDRDPLAEEDERHAQRRQTLIDTCERLLQGAGDVALAGHLSALSAVSAMREFSTLAEAHLRADVPYTLLFADGVRVDATSLRALSWLTPVTLHAQAAARPRLAELAQEAAGG